MRKREELTDPSSCLNRAKENEQLFILLERDLAFPATVRDWIGHRLKLGLNQPDDPQIIEAQQQVLTVLDAVNTRRIALAEKKSRGELNADEIRKFDQLQAAFFDYLDSREPTDPAKLTAIKDRLEGNP